MRPDPFFGGPCPDTEALEPPAGPESVWLPRDWASTAELAKAGGVGTRRAHRTLEQLHAAGILEHASRGDAELWRLVRKTAT